MTHLSTTAPTESLRSTAREKNRFFFRILWGLGLGIFTGLFLGDQAEKLKVIGDIYVGLMQMTVVPYIFFSLIGSIGRLSLQDVKHVARWVVIIQLLLWASAAVTTILLSSAFPEIERGSFFSSARFEAPSHVDFIQLFVPSNLFRALTENSVPAIVVFCILFGFGVIGLEGKKTLIDQFGLVAKALHRVNGMVIRFTPFGTFGIAAYTAGTMTLSELEKLQAYYVSFGLLAAILIFLVMPLIVTVTTPFTYRSLILASRNALLTCFVTGSVLAVIPMLVQEIEELFHDLKMKSGDDVNFYPDFVVPLAYPFPNSGNAAALIFIPFAAWFLGQTFHFHDQLTLFSLGFFLMFGKVFIAIPFLLNLFHIPIDMFDLFLTAGVISSRLGDVLGSMHQMVFTIVTTAAMAHIVKIRWGRLLQGVGVIAIALLISTISLSKFVSLLEPETDEDVKRLSSLELVEPPVTLSVHEYSEAHSKPLGPNESRINRIKADKKIRVGFKTSNLPYSYYNKDNELVGFDIDMVMKLARDLNVEVEFIPYRSETLKWHFERDHFDIAISGITDTTAGFSQWLTTDPYLDTRMGFLVRDHEKERFEDRSKIAQESDLRFGVIRGGYFENWLKINFPQADFIRFESMEDFFEKDHLNVDAMAAQAESAAAWTLLYPEYTVVTPKTQGQSAPVSIAVAGYDVVLRDALSTWIQHQKMNGSITRWYDHWILGKDLRPKKARWSIMRDVLHLGKPRPSATASNEGAKP